MSTMLTKTLLHQTIISIISNNSLGYEFIKSNYRHYYFRREATYEKAKDLMIITVYFEQGIVSCSLQSHVHPTKDLEFTYSSGILNRYTFMLNSKPNSLGRIGYQYYFKKNVESLTDALKGILYDLDIKGKEWVAKCDNRYSYPKFAKGMEFINELTVSKEELKNAIPIHHFGSWWQINHEKFKELELLLEGTEDVDNANDHEDFRWVKKNSLWAFEFLAMYIYKADKR